VPVKPSSGFQSEISSEEFDSNEVVGLLNPIDMFVISLPGLIVEAHDADAVHYQRQPVLEVVSAAAQRDRHAPGCFIGERPIADRSTPDSNFDRIHHTTAPTVM
jgi:hypothetical protein